MSDISWPPIPRPTVAITAQADALKVQVYNLRVEMDALAQQITNPGTAFSLPIATKSTLVSEITTLSHQLTALLTQLKALTGRDI